MWPFSSNKGASGFSARSTAEEVTEGIDGTGLTAIVTGASSGIGAETTRVLALRGVHVVMAVRNMEAGRNVKEAILNKSPTSKIDVMELDLSSMASVQRFASEFTSSGLPLNILINNAGVMTFSSEVSKDNIELIFATNHIGHFLLTNLLLDTMKSTARQSKKEGRIINVSSDSHRSPGIRFQSFDRIQEGSKLYVLNLIYSFFTYGQSKLANILHAKELGRRLKEEEVEITANSLHPGVVNTKIMRNNRSSLVDFIHMFFRFSEKSLEQGAATTCYVALHPKVKGVTGEYFEHCNIANPSSLAKDAALAKSLWELSMSITKQYCH